ncbi:tubulin polyglutamylase TTLL7-like [Notothenia coriiceps]|uniref:Tubulin polyglutamylase TTLL7-like n=1 Tax=Notothenia coriiceps TaxID=8208 RepID=A0A6I9MNC6_9TELE|nr:PREDICTED: tubulin polyglutamylase TTLL7-like [Notothenia coriiceps]
MDDNPDKLFPTPSDQPLDSDIEYRLYHQEDLPCLTACSALIHELVVKTIIVAEPHVLHAYRMCRPGQPPGSDSVCFEVLGFDIILDRKLKPWLLEINRAPSFGTDQKIDHDVKKGVLLDALKLLNIRASDKKRNLAQQKAEAQRRLYGHGSVKKLSAASSDWEKQRHTLERRREELHINSTSV